MGVGDSRPREERNTTHRGVCTCGECVCVVVLRAVHKEIPFDSFQVEMFQKYG